MLRCIALQYAASCYAILRYVTLRYDMLPSATLHSVALRDIALRGATLCYIATHYFTLAMLCYITLCCFMSRCVAPCYSMLRCAVLRGVPRRYTCAWVPAFPWAALVPLLAPTLCSAASGQLSNLCHCKFRPDMTPGEDGAGVDRMLKHSSNTYSSPRRSQDRRPEQTPE